MSTVNVKKFDVGKLSIDLPSSYCIHELPLFKFVDVHQSFGVSLIFNFGLMKENVNTFLIKPGYKFNFQKRIIIEGSNYSVQDASGKIEDAYGEFNVYSFDDESKRIMRIREENNQNVFIIEYPDYSYEVYDNTGKIIESYDKYGVKVLEYNYNSDGTLNYLLYRNERKIVLSYENSTVSAISYYYNNNLVCTNTFTYSTYSLTIAHYTGSYYVMESTNLTYYVHSKEELSSSVNVKSITYDVGTYNYNIYVRELVNSQVVNETIYYSTEWSETPDYSSTIDITNYYNVQTRMQFYGRNFLCSYEIDNNTVQFNSHIYPKEVMVHRLDNIGTTYSNGIQTVNDGLILGYNEPSPSYTGLEPIGWNSDNYKNEKTDGYYIVSCWAKTTNPNEVYYLYYDGDASNSLYLNNLSTEWKYYSFLFYSNSAVVKINLSSSLLYINDLRLSFQKTEEKNGKILNSYVQENILINKTNGNVISLTPYVIKCSDGFYFDYSISINDLFKYKINKKKNINLDELYYNNLKNVYVSNDNILVIDGDNEVNLDNYDLGYRTYRKSKEYITKIEIDEASTYLYKAIFYIDGVLKGYKEYDSNSNLVKSNNNGVTTTYQYSNGLITEEKVDNLYTRTKSYSKDTLGNQLITKTNEFNNSIIYKMNKIWGTVEQITLPDLTVLSNEYDENNIVQVKKCVTKDSLKRSNEISYLNDFVSRLGTDNLKYSFNYSKNDLERVSRVSLNDSNEEVLNITEQHTYNIDSNKETTVVNNYPSSSPRLYYETIKYNKYGQLINDAGKITCTYDVDSYFIQSLTDSSQYSFGSIGVNSKNGKLATLTDLKTEEVIKYGYNKDNLEYVFRYDEDGTNIKKTIYTYDKNKLTSIKYTYDVQNDNTFESKIYYIESSDQSLDEKVDKYEYLQNDTVELTTTNIYDLYGRTLIKKYTLGNKEYRHTFTYDLTRLLTETNESGVVSYQYDQLNRIIKKTKGNYVTNYQYDIYGQLIREDNGRLNKTYQYEYDNIGNIVSKKTYNYTTGILGDPSITKNFSYTNETYKDRLTSYSNKSITYNIVGAVTSYDGDTFTWTSGKLTKITNGNVSTGTNQYTYTYNGLGQRIKKTYTYLQGLGSITALQPGQLIGFVKKYEYDENGRLVIEEITSSYYQSSQTLEKLTYLYNDNMIIGFKYYANGTTNNYYYERNVFGDVIGIYDMSGNRVVEYAYDAWGNCTLYNVSNYTLANLNPIRYRGYYFDKESNLYFCDARYYSSELCRWISPDSIEYLDLQSINGLNLYAYCGNDPVNYKQRPASKTISNNNVHLRLSHNISSKAVEINTNGYSLGLKITMKKKKLAGPIVEIKEDGQLFRFDFSKNPDYNIFTSFYYANKLYEMGLPDNRTYEGIWFELLGHYIIHKLDIFDITDRDDVADMGSFAEDENARFFEIIIHGLIEGLKNWYYDKW